MSELLVPFAYDYMVKAMWVSALVGGTCAFLSAFLMIKGWSLMGDALAHSIVPGVAGAYLLKLPYAAGAFLAGLLAAFGMAFVRSQTRLREDASKSEAAPAPAPKASPAASPSRARAATRAKPAPAKRAGGKQAARPTIAIIKELSDNQGAPR